MATQQRSRSRRPSVARQRGPRHVEAVLDPNWQSPYTPSPAEREVHREALRRFALRRKRVEIIAGAVLAVAALVAAVVSAWFIVVALAIAAAVALDVRRSVASLERRVQTVGAAMLALFEVREVSKERQRLVTVIDRLTATFGVDAVRAFIVDDPGYNAALAPDITGYCLLVTNAMMRDFDLIELEGVIAHCLARQRLGVLARQSAAALTTSSPGRRYELAGPGLAYRADEVAAAAIRYPLGLAGALRRCARQVVPAGSHFTSPAYDQWRYLWFDMYSDRSAPDLADLDDVELRALALEEW